VKQFSLYILLVLIFLGLSKSFSLSEKGTKFISNEHIYAHHFEGSPLSLILLDTFETGFLIKTYFHKYKIVHGFRPSKIKIFRVSASYYKKSNRYLGMSLFRREELEQIVDTLPLPPGALYIGDRSYGRWQQDDSGLKKWKFYRAYRDFPNLFIWGNWKPSLKFYQMMNIFKKNENPYYGLHHQFGRDGSVVTKNYTWAFHQEAKAIDFIQYIEKFFNIPTKKVTK